MRNTIRRIYDDYEKNGMEYAMRDKTFGGKRARGKGRYQSHNGPVRIIKKGNRRARGSSR